MSEEWPNGWYRYEQGRQAQPGFTPRLDALGSPYEPTQAVPPGGAAWPAQPPARSRPGDGGPPRTRGPQGRRPWLRPKRVLIILATLVVVLALAGAGLYFDLNSKLSQLASVAFALKNPVTTMVPFGGFGNTSAGSVVEWNVPEAKVFFNDLATDKPLPKNLITGASVAGTT